MTHSIKYTLLEILTNKYFIMGVTALISFISPLVPTLYFVGILVMSDFITGVIKAHKAQKLTSRRMSDKVWMTVGYFMAIMVAFAMEKYFGDAVPMVKAVVAIIALTEIQSLRENIEKITGTDILKPLIKILRQEAKEDEGDT